jgi:CubicO group peptidase (beta-lactamase class C family)
VLHDFAAPLGASDSVFFERPAAKEEREGGLDRGVVANGEHMSSKEGGGGGAFSFVGGGGGGGGM